MTLSVEVISALALAVGGLLASVGIWVRASANAKVTEANTERDNAQASNAHTTQLLKMFEHQVTINHQNQEAALGRDQVWQEERKAMNERLHIANETAEKNYKTFRQVSDDNARYLGNLIEASNKNTQDILAKLADRIDSLPERISERTLEDINPAIVAGIREGFSEFKEAFRQGFEVIGDRMAHTLGDRFDKALMKRDVHFPSPQNDLWRDMAIMPLQHYRPVHFYDQPAYDDNTRTKIELFEPVVGRVIPHFVADWHAVFISPYAYGFIPAVKVNCDLLPLEHPPVAEAIRVTGSYAAVNN